MSPDMGSDVHGKLQIHRSLVHQRSVIMLLLFVLTINLSEECMCIRRNKRWFSLSMPGNSLIVIYFLHMAVNAASFLTQSSIINSCKLHVTLICPLILSTNNTYFGVHMYVYRSIFVDHLYKRNSSNFQFDSQGKLVLSKWGQLLKERICSSRANSFL